MEPEEPEEIWLCFISNLLKAKSEAKARGKADPNIDATTQSNSHKCATPL